MSASTSTLSSSPTIISNDDQNKLIVVQPNDPLLTLPPFPFKPNHSFNVIHKNNLLDAIPSSHVDLAITPPLTPPHTSMNTPARSPNNYYFEGFEDVLTSYDSSPSSLNTSDGLINSNLITPVTDLSSLPSDDTKSNNKGEICVFTQVSTTIATVQQSPIPRSKFSKKKPQIRSYTSPHVKVTKSSDQSSSDNTAVSNLEIDPYLDSSISATTSDIEKDSSKTKNHSNSSDSITFDGTLLTDYAMENPKRNKEYHSFFKSVPNDEYLLNDFGCALQKEILVQGRIYVSLNHICFHANILGWVTDVVVPFSDIIRIEKKSTAIVIPNAILITTIKSKYLFASFIFRDVAYELFVKLWQRVNSTYGHSPCLSEGGSDYTTVSQTSRSINNISYNSNSYNSSTDSEPTKDSEYEKSKSRNGKFSLPRLNLMSKQSSRNFDQSDKSIVKDANTNSPLQSLSSTNIKDCPSVNDANNISDNGNMSESNSKRKIPPTLSISIPKISYRQQTNSSNETRQPKETICKCLKQNDHSTFVALDTKYSGSVESIYTILFDSNFVPEFVRKLENNNDTEFGEWSTNENGCMTRDSSLKSTKCYLKDEVLYKDFDDHATVITTTKTPDVPSGTSFCVKTRICIMWAGANKTRVIVTACVEFSKKTFLKVPIEKGSMNGQLLYFKSLDKALRKHILPKNIDFIEHPLSKDDDSMTRQQSKPHSIRSKRISSQHSISSFSSRISSHRSSQINLHSRKLQNEDEEINLLQLILSTSISILSQILETILCVIGKLRLPNLETLLIWVLLLSFGVNIWIWISMRDINYKIENMVQRQKIDFKFHKKIEMNDNEMFIRRYLLTEEISDNIFDVEGFDKILDHISKKN
ncbi:19359_t:CDS:2 [Cetraspora pellucida]|uniref:19359_t:CDS:1 n=1 Tax=Cetraspora pellucida TaxID=1433469 RepID=A0A9N8WIF3_9GLOM|nr:19359_t:CDS:2 [Cetraspora pellucida]